VELDADGANRQRLDWKRVLKVLDTADVSTFPSPQTYRRVYLLAQVWPVLS